MSLGCLLGIQRREREEVVSFFLDLRLDLDMSLLVVDGASGWSCPRLSFLTLVVPLSAFEDMLEFIVEKIRLHSNTASWQSRLISISLGVRS